MKKKFSGSSRPKEKILLTDVLPFETPLSFSNRHFYRLVKELKIRFEDDGSLYYKKESTYVKRLSDKQFDGNLVNAQKAIKSVLDILFNCSEKKSDETIPYSYRIIHKDVDFRELTVIHPRNQLRVMEYIYKNCNMIIDCCAHSRFSLRAAQGLAEDSKPAIQSRRSDYKEDYFELDTFFKYKFKNVYKFYESYTYQRAESKFNHLFTFDISKCFDSIYTHSITWAVYGKYAVKNDVKKSKHTFAGKFDELMQRMAYNETNGIVIGPEFSRVFAEMILQRIDKDVFEGLPDDIVHKIDFELYRYVDDYFLFYNDPHVKDCIFERYELKLREYKMAINHAKSDSYERPAITQRTIFNIRVGEFLKEFGDLLLKTESMFVSSEDENGEKYRELDKEKLIFCLERMNRATDAKKAKTLFKAIVKETEMELKDILPYTLGLMVKRTEAFVEFINEFKKDISEDDEPIVEQCAEVLLNLIDITFFIYAMAPRVNSTIKVCGIISSITSLLGEPLSPFKRRKHKVFQLIFNKISDVLSFNSHKVNKEYAKLESLYLLVVMKELGKEYWVPVDKLEKYLGFRNAKGGPVDKLELDYFQIVVILFYIGRMKRYEPIRTRVLEQANDILKGESVIKTNYGELKKKNMKKAESVMLFFDLLACPYLSLEEKKAIADSFGIKDDKDDLIDVIEFQEYWFTKWDKFNLQGELATMKNSQVY